MKKGKILVFVFAIFAFVIYAKTGINVKADENQQGRVSQIALGDTHSAAIEQDGTLWMWGNNRDKQVSSDKSDKEILSPLKVMDGVTSVSLGSVNTAAIKEDGSLWIWGTTILEDLDKYPASERSKPHKIMENVKAVSLGGSTGAAIKEDGTLWMWGTNAYGQIGDGSQTNCEKPKKIMENVKSVSLGIDYSAAIKEDGTLWMWGQNSNGKLGDGTTERSLSPKKIMEDVKSVSLGLSHSAAIKEDNTLWTWGWNGAYQLGNGTNFEIHNPQKIMDNVKSVSLGYNHSGAIKYDGTLWMWGENYSGQIGSENINMNVCDPKKIDSDVKDVQLSNGYSAFLKNDNTMWMMGRNDYGQLGRMSDMNDIDLQMVIFEFAENDYFQIGKDNNQYQHEKLFMEFYDEKYKNKIEELIESDPNSNFLDKYWFNLVHLKRHKEGVCYGTALAMCYGNTGLINFNEITKGALNYWMLGNPYDNKKMKDMIVFYHLTQYLKNSKVTREIKKEGWKWGQNYKLKDFLFDLTCEAKRSQEEKKPFIFTFKSDVGIYHTVVVCGYQYDDKSKKHEIKIYDLNTYNSESSGSFSKMTVESDYSNFKFADAILSDAGKTLQDTWRKLEYCGIDDLYNSKIINPDIGTFAKEKNISNNSEQMTIQIPVNKKFRLENAEGSYLEYDGKKYISDMKIVNCRMRKSAEDSIWDITVEKSNLLKLTKAENGCKLVCMVGDKGYAITADGAESVIITSEKIRVDGSKYNLDVALDPCDSNTDILTINANINGACEINNDKNISLKCEEKGENIQISKYANFEKTSSEQKENIYNSVLIIKGSENNIENNYNVKNETRVEKKQENSSIKLKKITIKGISKRIAAGKSIKLTANISPKNCKNKLVTWKSSNKKLAKVDKKGNVKISKKAAGKIVIITAIAKDGSNKKATYKIKVMKGIVKNISVKGKHTVKAGEKIKLTTKVTASKGANKKIVWKSSNTKYVTVSSSGEVKAKKIGKNKTIKVTAMATDGSGKKKVVKIKIV